MIEAAESAISDSDVCIWLIDMSSPRRPKGLMDTEREIGARLSESGLPVLVLLNKLDVIKDKSVLLPTMEAAAAVPGVREVLPVSAMNGEGVENFIQILKRYLPEGPKLFPEEMLSEPAERFFIAELIPEALTDFTRQEIPYHSAVVVEKFVEEPKRCAIHAAIHVERTSQRAIVIGRRGAMIREIGKRARLAAEAFLGSPVFLKLHVEVSPGWTKDASQLKKMGYE
jgi:GTP-binding protein Era